MIESRESGESVHRVFFNQGLPLVNRKSLYEMLAVLNLSECAALLLYAIMTLETDKNGRNLQTIQDDICQQILLSLNWH